MDELVSVVITTYKRDFNVLDEAINSVLHQTYENIELILVDDNGKDTPYQINNEKGIAKYNKLRYYVNECNSGAQVSRNIGILNSRGDYIAFLDDDDLWDREKIHKQMEAFGNNADAGMIFCNGYFFKKGSNNLVPYREKTIIDKPVSFDMLLMSDCIGTTSQALIKKSVFAKVGLFDIEMPARQDYEMWLRISKDFKIVGINDYLFFYRVHEGERISTDYHKCSKSYHLILQKYKAQLSKNRKCKSRFYLTIAKAAFKNGMKFKFFIYLIRAFCVSPVYVCKDIRRIKKEDKLNRIDKTVF